MPAQKKLLILSLDKKVHAHLKRMVGRIIGDKVRISDMSINDVEKTRRRPDVILVSGPFLVPKASRFFPDTPVIAPVRTITGHNLEKVMRIPAGQRALVVTSHQEAVEGTINGLLRLGIDHIDYLPYWGIQEIDSTDIDLAITPGMAYLVPKCINHVIDIGPRQLSIYSFLRLLSALNLDMALIEEFANQYHRHLMNFTWKLVEVLDRSEWQRKFKEVVINEFEDGVLSVNENGMIGLANNSALKMLGRTSTELIHSPYSELKENFEKLAEIKIEPRKPNKISGIFSFGGKKIVLSKIPIDSDKQKTTIITLKEIDTLQRMEEKVRRQLSRKGFVAKYRFSDINTASPAVEQVIKKAAKFAKTGKNILITGESGTGKELFAHAIHRNSPQRKGPFVAVNFAGLPESLIESELFGYEEGAFTGALKGGKKGFFEQAHGGTIFLDEVGDAPLNLQKRLLRVLQEKEVMRVGSSRILPIEVRIVAATNTNLHSAMRNGTFREDLYYRLNTLPIEIPPLRHRKEDIMLILETHLKKNYGISKTCCPIARQGLLDYHWPGNIRELINAAEYICFSSEERGQIELEDLPPYMFSSEQDHTPRPSSGRTSIHELADDLSAFAGPSNLVFQCLKALQASPGMGRLRLIEELKRGGIDVTEGKIRRVLTRLKSQGLISVGRTRQGATITKRGVSLFQLLMADRSSELREP